MAAVNKFESPSNEYESLSSLNLHELVVGHQAHAVFFAWASGDGLKSVGIFSGDLLVANRAATPRHEDCVIALVSGEFVARIYDEINGLLVADNEPPVSLEHVVIEAVITQSLRCHRGVSK